MTDDTKDQPTMIGALTIGASEQLWMIQSPRYRHNQVAKLRWFQPKPVEGQPPVPPILQVGYPWTQGDKHGIDWEDVPIVVEGEEGS